MKTMKIWLCIYITINFCLKSINAQIFDPEKTAKRTETKVKNRVNRKVDNTINDGLDEVFNSKKSKTKQTNKNTTSKIENSNVIDVETIAKNDFIGQFRLEIETSENGKVNDEHSGNAQYYFFETKSICIPKKENIKDVSTYIFDLIQKSVTIIKDKDKKKVAVIQYRPLIKVVRDESSVKKPKMEVTKLSTTSFIEGKKCNKYIIDEENCVSTIWVCSELPFNFRNLMISSTLENDDNGLLSEIYNKIDGLPLRIIREYKTLDKTVNIYIRNIIIGKPDSDLASLKDCEIIDIRN